jgi:hypothetical protein
VGPTTTVRSTSTTINVKDGQTIVIGGLISDSITSQESRIPFITEIPVIGNLFKSQTRNKQKINLLAFLTPHIIKNEEDAAEVSINERDRYRESLDRDGVPRRRPDPLDMPTFNLPEERELPAGQPGASIVPGAGATLPGPLELTAVTVDRRKDGAALVLALAGNPTEITHYAIAEPGRIVVDVYGDSAKRAKVEIMKVNDPLVRKVRVAHHAGRMRLVIDLATDEVPAYDLASRGGTVTVSLGAARPEAATPPEQHEHHEHH